MTRFKCTEIEVNGNAVEKVKQSALGAVLEKNVLDMSDLNIATRLSDEDASQSELVVTLRLKRETEYTGNSAARKAQQPQATAS